ncbi:MAG: anti-sigma factor family protein [Blastopirellula sp. JB062]
MNEHESESWRPCRAGELAEVAKNLVSLRRRRLAIQTVSSLFSVFLVIGAVLWLGPAYMSAPLKASITCSECHSHMPAYHTGSLSAAQMQRMQAHFRHCRGCKNRYEAMLQEHGDCCDPNCPPTDNHSQKPVSDVPANCDGEQSPNSAPPH